MVRNTRYLGAGALSVLLVGVAAGCANQASNPDNIPGPQTTAVNTASMPKASGMPAKPFDDAAITWGQIEGAQAKLDTSMKAGKLDEVHAATSEIRDLVKTLPDKSSMLPEDKRQILDTHVKNVGQLTMMMDGANHPSDMKSVEEHQGALNDALGMIKGIYPKDAMQSPMHMPDMGSSGTPMGDDGSMPAKPMGGMGMPDDNMSGKPMSKPTDAGKMPGMGGMGMGMGDKMMSGMGDMPGMGGMAMGDDKMPAKPMGGMGMDKMDDKMMSGMSSSDKKEMQMMMDKMAAMPPAQRKKAMQKMSSTTAKPAPVKPPAPSGAPMPGGAMTDM